MQHETPTRTAVLKVSYLLAVTVVAFAVPALSLTEPGRWFVIPGLAGIQAVILLACRVGLRDVARVALRLKWLFVFLIGMYALLPPENPSANDVLMDWHVPGVGWSLSINLSGLEKAALMCLQIVTVLLASAVVPLTGTGRDLVDGLHAFRFPLLFVHALDRTLALLEGTQGRERGGGRASKRTSRAEFFAVLRQVLRGDIGAFADVVRANIALAENQVASDADPRVGGQFAHDVAVTTGIALCMASLKMLKILPGLPFASGHKTFLLFPLYVPAACSRRAKLEGFQRSRCAARRQRLGSTTAQLAALGRRGDAALAGKGSSPRHGRDVGQRQRSGRDDMGRPRT